MKAKLRVIKIGSNVIDDPKLLDTFLADFAQIKEQKILVHGGGKRATLLSKQLGIQPQLVDGRRITSSSDLEIVTMVYAGLINKSITAKLQSLGSNAMGLSGADGNTITAVKRPIDQIDFGWVGDITAVNSKAIQGLLEQNITPVFCALTHDGKGQLLNTNADTIAAEIAIAMSNNFDTELIYCFEKNGVLSDIDDDNSVITKIDTSRYSELKQKNIIHEGMLPKLENSFHALNEGVSKVIVGSISSLNDNNTHTTLSL